MRARFVPLVLIGALVLASCDGSGSDGHASASGPRPTATAPAPTDPSTTLTRSGPPAPVTPTVPADVPTTGPNLRSPGEKPPVMPLEATQHTPAGAVAFAKFFIHTIDWGFATTSGAYMRHYYAASCVACGNHAAGLDGTRRAGHHYAGSRFTITAARELDEQTAAQSAEVTFDISAMEVVDGQGAFVSADIPRQGMRQDVSMDWRSGQWVVVGLRTPS